MLVVAHSLNDKKRRRVNMVLGIGIEYHQQCYETIQILV